MKAFMGKRKKHKIKSSRHPPPPPPPLRCGSLCCCSSRLSVSSSDGGVKSSSNDSEQLDSLSRLAHGMVQARLEQMVNQSYWQQPPPRVDQRPPLITNSVGERLSSSTSNGCIVLVAVDKRSYDPKGDFKMSILEVITSKRVEEPKQLRSLLNCYMSVNSPQHRQVILEAFHEVCSALFRCSS